MKIGIVGDIHFCTFSSLVRQKGQKYSVRLENCIQSINWAEELFLLEGCDQEIYLGDFFDSSTLSAQEITALSEINFNTIPKKFLVGNHEMGRSDLQVSSAHLFFSQYSNIDVINKPLFLNYSNFSLGFIPYILEEDRRGIKDYMPTNLRDKKYLFSHNDLRGMTLGKFKSTSGFDIDEIKNNCTYYFNGHLHNYSMIYNIINVGNLTGQNFSEDAFRYPHQVMILNTDTNVINLFSNPYAMNFYKLDNIKDLKRIKDNSVITVKCFENEYSEWKSNLDNNLKVLTYRINIQQSIRSKEELIEEVKVLAVNHLDEFRRYIISQLGESEYVLSELEEICK